MLTFDFVDPLQPTSRASECRVNSSPLYMAFWGFSFDIYLDIRAFFLLVFNDNTVP